MASYNLTNLKRIRREIETIKDNTDPTSDETLADMIVKIEAITDQAIQHLDPSGKEK